MTSNATQEPPNGQNHAAATNGKPPSRNSSFVRTNSGDLDKQRNTSSTTNEINEINITPVAAETGNFVTQAFARLTMGSPFSSLKSSASSTTTITTTTTTAASSNTATTVTSTTQNTFWRRPGKVPGSIRPVSQTLSESSRTNSNSARAPTPPVTNSEATADQEAASAEDLESSSSSVRSLSSSGRESPTLEVTRTHSPAIDFILRGGSEDEHNCNHFKSCGTPQERVGRLKKFLKILDDPVADVEALKKLSWKGIPAEVRPMTWRLLSGYLPANSDRRDSTLQRKRKEYHDCVPQYFSVPEEDRTDYELKIYRQIHIDIPRTNPTIPLFQQQVVQDLLERILYIWAIRHPASGYVQGINDLATPFFVVFLSEFVDDIDSCDVSQIPPESLAIVEADSFWCMSKLLDGIQDHYTFAQPGLQRMIYKLKELIGRIDAPLSRHLEEQGAEFIQFAFRWMNCLLMREVPLPLVVRMWDTYLAEGPSEGFGVFHIYVCASFLSMWSGELRQREFQDIMLFLQHLPTTNWRCKDIEMLMSQAFMWNQIFGQNFKR